ADRRGPRGWACRTARDGRAARWRRRRRPCRRGRSRAASGTWRNSIPFVRRSSGPAMMAAMETRRAIEERRLARLYPVRAWPTREEAAASLWFSPIAYGPRRARDRTWGPALVPWGGADEGDVTDAVVDWCRRLAQGKPGVLVVEATGIRDVPSGPLLRIGHDRYVGGLGRIVEAVREASEGRTLLFI